jgi:hypothetical protein
MRFFCFAMVLLSLTIFSCRTSKNENENKEEVIGEAPGIIINEDGTATITGRIRLDNGGRTDSFYYYVRIEDENGTIYNVSPREKEDELRRYQDRLIKFTVIVHDNPLGYGRKTVTPISWEIIEGDPVELPKITELGIIQLTGVINIVFSTPRVFIYIIKDNERWLITSEEMDGFLRMDGYTVTVEGEGVITETGFPSIRRRSDDVIVNSEFSLHRVLRNIRIIEVQTI